MDRECLSELHSASVSEVLSLSGVRTVSPKKWAYNNTYLLTVILKIMVKCSAFITDLIVLSVVSINIVFVKPKTLSVTVCLLYHRGAFV